MLLGDGLDHELEERDLVGRRQRIGEVPVDLELAIRILMVVLVGAPAEAGHGGADLGNDIEPAHDGGLVVTGLFRRVAVV